MSEIEHLDFEAPSEVDIAMEDLLALGAEVERVKDRIRSRSRRTLWPGMIRRIENGPLRFFRVDLHEDASPEATVDVLRQAASLIRNPGNRFDDLGDRGLCLGSPVTVDGKS